MISISSQLTGIVTGLQCISRVVYSDCMKPGRFPWLTENEQIRAVGISIAAANGRVPVTGSLDQTGTAIARDVCVGGCSYTSAQIAAGPYMYLQTLAAVSK